MTATQRHAQVLRALGRRRLIFFGPRGEDALPLAPLGCLDTVFSLVAPARHGLEEICLEDLSGRRVDLNAYVLDDDISAAAERLRDGFFASLSRPVAVIPYSPSNVLTCGLMTSLDSTLLLGMLVERQAAFELKPWVENELRKLGVPTLPWHYTRYLTTASVAEMFSAGPALVVRFPRSRGGMSLWVVAGPEELAALTETRPREGYYCVTPFLSDTVPVNVNACAFCDGRISLHGCSIQLVGVPLCTARPLGYAGNDFGALANLPKSALASLDRLTRKVGTWLASQGFIGAFGLDALIRGDEALFVEVNPRFQASSAVATTIDTELDRPSQFIEHTAAFLGDEPHDAMTLPELVSHQPAIAHAVLYNRGETAVSLHTAPVVPDFEVRLLPEASIAVNPHAILAVIRGRQQMSHNGQDLTPAAERAAHAVLDCFLPA